MKVIKMKNLTGIVAGALCLITIIISPFLITSSEVESQSKTVVLTVWHVDGFEGGRGSRYTFLRDVAVKFSKQNKGVYPLVSSYTVEGANDLIKKGKHPDLISFGGSLLNLQHCAKEISFSGRDGGTVGNKRYAVSYIKGGYFVIKKGEGSKDIIISKQEGVTPEIATLFSGEEISSITIKPSLDAYSLFLLKKNATMIGTQRDIERLISRGETFTAKVIEGYSDLFQYVSLTCDKADNEYYANKFIEFLLSEKVQSEIKNLKMSSVNLSGQFPDNEYLSALEKAQINYTFSPFSAKENMLIACDKALNLINTGGDYNEIINFTKQL